MCAEKENGAKHEIKILLNYTIQYYSFEKYYFLIHFMLHISAYIYS